MSKQYLPNDPSGISKATHHIPSQKSLKKSLIHVSRYQSDSRSIIGRRVSGSADRTIRVWDMSTHHCVGVLDGHDGIFSLVF